MLWLVYILESIKKIVISVLECKYTNQAMSVFLANMYLLYVKKTVNETCKQNMFKLFKQNMCKQTA